MNISKRTRKDTSSLSDTSVVDGDLNSINKKLSKCMKTESKAKKPNMAESNKNKTMEKQMEVMLKK